MQPGVGYSVYNSGKGLTLDINKPWQGEFSPVGTQLVIELYRPHPFRIVKLTSLTPLAGGFFYNFTPDRGDTFTVIPGTVNDVPCSLGITSCSTGIVFVYVQTYPTASINIIASSTILVDDDEAAYILIGTVTAADKHQYVHGNIQCERFVLGQEAASYHYSSDDLL